MSYASVTSHNAPPLSEQPHPDPALLNTSPPTHVIPDNSAKVNIVPPDFKGVYDTRASDADRDLELDPEESFPSAKPPASSRGKKRLQEVEAEGLYLWETAKHYLIQPAVARGLLGLGLLASVGRIFYLRPHLRHDARAISSTIAASVALISVESFAAEKYRPTPFGQDKERRATKEGLISRCIHQQIIRPSVLGGLVGIVTLLTLWGGEGYLSS